MLHNGTRQLFDYWNELRDTRAAPMRAEISPAAISKILPSTFILQENENGALKFRLAGTALCLLFGNELKGEGFIELIDRDDQNLTKRTIQAVLKENVGVVMHLEALCGDDKSVYLEVLLLPLLDQEPRIVGTLHTMDMPYWIGAEEVESLTIKAIRLMDADVDLISLHNRPSIMMNDRARARAKRTPSPRFAVLQGGAMLGALPMASHKANENKPKLTVLDGGRRS